MTLLRHLRRNHPRAAPVGDAPAVAPPSPPPPAVDVAPMGGPPMRRRRRVVGSTPVQTPSELGPPVYPDHPEVNDDGEPDNLITDIITRVDRDPEVMREQTGTLHVTAVINDCPRMIQLARSSPVTLYTPAPTGGHRVMWLLGRAVEHHIRSTYITAVQGVGVRGRWLCRCGHTEIEQVGWPDAICPRCEQPPRTYGEITLRDPVSGLSGRPDLITVTEDPGGEEDTIIEIKSMNGPDFDELDTPHGSHLEQATLYRRLNILTGRRTRRNVRVIYCTKVFVFGNPYKERSVDVGEGTVWDEGASMYLETANAINRPELLPRHIGCTDPHRPKPRACPTCVDCFVRPA